MRERNVLRKLVELMAVVCLMTMLLGMTSLAADKVEGLALGQVVTNTDADNSITHYYKFKVKQSGALVVSAAAVNGNYTLGLDISLCNANGKVLSTNFVHAGSPYESSRYVMYGLNKGTYKIKVKTPYAYSLQAAFKKYPEKSGKTQSKAVTLKKGRIKKGVVGIGESAKKADWYKIVLKKPAKFSVTFDTETSGTLYATLIPSKSTKVSGTYNMYSYNQPVSRSFKVTPGDRNLPAGTYYLKVYRASRDSKVSGVYALRWK